MPSPVAIVTGAGSGIGRATAVLLAQRGHALVLAGRRLDPLEQTAERVAAATPAQTPVDALCVACDVADPADVHELIDSALDRFARIDALVNNAGHAPLLPIDQHTPEVLDETYAVNALGPAYATAACWPVFVRQNTGCVVNVSTMGTLDPFAGFFGYAAAKAAVNVMAKSCAKEGRPHNIRAFAIAPAAVETPMLRALFDQADVPSDRCLAPEAVARVIAACIAGERDGDNGRTIFLSYEGELDPARSP